MTITLHADPVPLHVDDTGAIRVGTSAVTLEVLLEHWRLGMKPEEIAHELDSLTMADVHGALAYYFRHQHEIDAYLRRRKEEAEHLRHQIEAANASRLVPLKARLDPVKAQSNGLHAPISRTITFAKVGQRLVDFVLKDERFKHLGVSGSAVVAFREFLGREPVKQEVDQLVRDFWEFWHERFGQQRLPPVGAGSPYYVREELSPDQENAIRALEDAAEE